jgi:Asp-tRNA(Asn)/Glu-tRNA(Gln) amidotransferase A subunit family amidase
MIAELIDMPAWRGATEIAEGRLTAEAWVRALLERVGEREPQVRAWACLDGERALESARECDSRPQRSLLRGVPFGVKDIIDTVDFPTEYGSSIYRGYRPPADAACVAIPTRQDGHHGVRASYPSGDPSSGGSCEHPRRILKWVGRGRGG